MILPCVGALALVATPPFSAGWAAGAGLSVAVVAGAGAWVGARPPSRRALRRYTTAVFDLTAVLLGAAVWRYFEEPPWLGVLLAAALVGTAGAARLQARALLAWFQARPGRAGRVASAGGTSGALGYGVGLLAGRIFGTGAGAVLLPLLFATALLLVAIGHMLAGASASPADAAEAPRPAR